MKFKYIISAFALLSLAVISCEKQEVKGGLSNATVSNSYVRLPEAGGEQTITLTTNDEWTFVVKCQYDTSYTDAIKGKVKEKKEVEQLKHTGNEWLTVSPMSGKGDKTITFHADATDAPRSIDLLLKVGDEIQHIIVRQQELVVEEMPISSCAEVAEKGGSFRVKGICVSITSDYYGNWFLQDDKGDAVYIYGTVDASGSYNWSSFGIALGDEVTIEGPKHPSYTGTWNGKTVPELVDVRVLKVKKSLLAADKTEIAIPAEANDFEVVLDQKGTGLSFKSETPWLTIKDNGYVANKKGKIVFTVSAEANTGARRSGQLVFTSSKLNDKGVQETSTVPVSIIQLVPETKGDLNTIAQAISASTNSKNPAPFDVTIPKSTVVYVNGSNTFLESENAAILVYQAGLGLSVGQTVEGRVFGGGCWYNNLPEVVELNTSLAKIGAAPLNPADLPQPKEITLDELMKNWDKYFSRLIKIKNLKVTDAINATYEVTVDGKKTSGDRSGKVTDGTNTIATYMQVKEYLDMDADKYYDVICIPTINKTTKQLGIWTGKHVTEAK